MDKKIIVPNKIVTADPENRILSNHAVEISDGKIKKVSPFISEKFRNEKVEHYENLVMIPGFIQTHVHLCQTLFRGLADDLELLDWLQLKIFPYENAHNKNSLSASIRLGLYELIKSGTTAILDMGTLRHQEIIFEEIINSGIRAFAGKCMMDRNDLFPSFKSTTSDEIKRTYDLASEFHNKNSKIKYGFAPRFVLSSSEKLLKETSGMMNDFPGSIYHTHASENKEECRRVMDEHGCRNIEYFEKINVLDKKTVLAHCVHVDNNEIDILSGKGVSVAHCPSSNLKLGSGIAPIPEFLKRNITVSLGADGAPCNNNLNMFQEMRLASLIQKPFHSAGITDALTIFRMATIEGAKALGIENETGSIEEGKKADLVLIDDSGYNSPLSDDKNIYSGLVYSLHSDSVKYVMAEGEWLVQKGEVKGFDERELVEKGKEELKLLLKRI